jgi:hypothetical protein
LDSIPRLLIDDPVVLARVKNPLVVNHPGVEDVGQGRVQLSSGERLSSPDRAFELRSFWLTPNPNWRRVRRLRFSIL